MLRHMDRMVSVEKEQVDIKRITSLSNFQLSILKKASTFPSVNTIVYSTCSVHQVENEDVVARFLAGSRQQGWIIEAPNRFKSWNRRGLTHDGLSAEESNALIRCDGDDETNGFFVALFRKNVLTVHGGNHVHSNSNSNSNNNSNSNSNSNTNNYNYHVRYRMIVTFSTK